MDSQVFTEFISQKGKVLVDFYATWCGPCKMIAPSLEELSAEGYQILKVDVDESPELASEFQVMSVPTLLVFEDGKLVKNEKGYMPKEVIAGMLS